MLALQVAQAPASRSLVNINAACVGITVGGHRSWWVCKALARVVVGFRGCAGLGESVSFLGAISHFFSRNERNFAKKLRRLLLVTNTGALRGARSDAAVERWEERDTCEERRGANVWSAARVLMAGCKTAARRASPALKASWKASARRASPALKASWKASARRSPPTLTASTRTATRYAPPDPTASRSVSVQCAAPALMAK